MAAITTRPTGMDVATASEVTTRMRLHFLRHILDEARSKRHDLVTHYTVDDLRVALGFQKPPDEAGPGRPPGTAHDSPDAHPEGGV